VRVQTAAALQASGLTDCGRLRDVNEDRCLVDIERGLLIVVDGLGGQLAGGKAADLGLKAVRERLEAPHVGPREMQAAIVAANNEIHRLAATRTEWHGMACVMTAALVRDGRLIAGHVGDTRLYKVRAGAITKITRDHSPVGELEDARRLTEAQAMQHPQRNEVYRDVGSEYHDDDAGTFADVVEMAFEPDAALLLCSDGLTDLVPLQAIANTIADGAGHPELVARRLIDAANGAGGKDNITVVYAEGPGFAAARRGAIVPAVSDDGGDEVITARLPGADAARPAEHGGPVWLPILTGILLVTLGAAWVYYDGGTATAPTPAAAAEASESGAAIVVRAGESITAALDRAAPGSTVRVEAGEYREQVRLRSDIRLVSDGPRAATLRLPATASEGDPAVTANNVVNAELAGFRIVGDAATPLGIGVVVTASSVAIVDVEITGASRTAIDFDVGASGSLVGSSIHDNPGAGLALRRSARPRISQNTFARNGYGGRTSPFVVAADAAPVIEGNVFVDAAAQSFATLPAGTRSALARDNWFQPRVRR
jgi:serine/threonine protein phosphatase PrpC